MRHLIRLRAASALLPCLVLLACAAPDPCADEAGACIAARVEGGVTGLQALAITVDRPVARTVTTPDPPRDFNLPVQVAVVLPAGTAGTVNVTIEGLAGGGARARASQAVDLPADTGRASATFVLTEPGAACPGVTVCMPGDGCCPSGCSGATDGDCPPVVCGDGRPEGDEVCDDNNVAPGDGCDPTCRFRNTLEVLSGQPGGSGFADSAVPAAVRFGAAMGLTTDGTRLWVADQLGGAIREVDPRTGATTTPVGTPRERKVLDGIAAVARFQGPVDVSYGDNALYVADIDPLMPTGGFVRRVDLSDPNRIVTRFNGGSGLYDGLRALAYGNTERGVRVAVLDKRLGLSAWRLNGGSEAPLANAMQLATAAGTGDPCFDVVYAGQSGGNFVYYVGCPAVILRVLTGTTPGVAVFAGRPGMSGCADNISAAAATLTSPSGLTLDAAGAVVFTDAGCNKVRRALTGVGTVAGSGTAGHLDGLPLAAQFSQAQALVRLGDDLFVLDGATLRRVAPDQVTTLVGVPASRGVAYGPSGTGSSFTVAGGLGSDGTSVFSTVGYLQELFAVSLQGGASRKLFNWPPPMMGAPPFPGPLVLLGGALHVAFNDGTLRRIGRDGKDDRLFTGVRNVSPVLRALGTDGTSLYYGDADGVVGRIDGQGVLTPIAGRKGALEVKDGTGGEARFAAPRDLVWAAGSLYVLDGPLGAKQLASVVRRVELPDGRVTTIAGQAGAAGSADGRGPDARFAGAFGLTSDGTSLFITDPGQGLYDGDASGPTVRQLVLATGLVSTMIGQRGRWSVIPGAGTAAQVNSPVSITYDAATRALILFDSTAFLRIR